MRLFSVLGFVLPGLNAWNFDFDLCDPDFASAFQHYCIGVVPASCFVHVRLPWRPVPVLPRM